MAAQPNLIKGLQADYVPVFYQGSNTSGLRALGKNIVVKVDYCSAVTSGGITLTDDRSERMTMQSTSGCIVQAGAEAFRWFEDGTPWVGHKPQIGERCYFEQYAGQIQVGIDGSNYRIMDYRSVACVVDMENEAVAEAMRAFEASYAEAAKNPPPLSLVKSGPTSSLNRKARRAAAAKA